VIRRELAEQHGVWMFNRIASSALPGTSSFELYVGDNLLNLPDDRAREILGIWSAALAN
jgi:hypothetical protein